MTNIKRGQDIGFICWTPVEGNDWLTASLPFSQEHELLETFDWGRFEADEEAANDDEESRPWAEAGRRSLASWVKENPY